MSGRMEFEFQFTPGQIRRPRGDDPMRILLCGDFSGQVSGNRSHTAVADRQLLPVDTDNFEQVLSRIAPRLSLGLLGSSDTRIQIEFRELSDFHPDSLYKRLEIFQALRDTRQRLVDPATFAQAAAEIGRGDEEPSPAAEAGTTSTAVPEQAPPDDNSSTIERLLGRQPVEQPHRGIGAASSSGVDFTSLIKDIVAPHIVPAPNPVQEQYVASIDQAIGQQMRAVLHDPAFQALESTWRAADWLVRSLEIGEALKVYLLDVTKQELADDILADPVDPRASGLYRLLVEQGTGTLDGHPWSLLVGDYTFGVGSPDVALLARLGAIASQAGGPFLAAADASVLGCTSLIEQPDPKQWHDQDNETSQRWRLLRGSPSAASIGLAHPRVLLRLPYGENTDEIEAFPLEEMPAGPDHEAYLWANPAVACAILIGTAFLERGWSMQPGDLQEIGDLAAHSYVADGEAKLQPCAEVLLPERAIDTMLSCGVMPLASYKNRNAVRVIRFQSLADPPAPLSGAWR